MATAGSFVKPEEGDMYTARSLSSNIENLDAASRMDKAIRFYWKKRVVEWKNGLTTAADRQEAVASPPAAGDFFLSDPA